MGTRRPAEECLEALHRYLCGEMLAVSAASRVNCSLSLISAPVKALAPVARAKARNLRLQRSRFSKISPDWGGRSPFRRKRVDKTLYNSDMVLRAACFGEPGHYEDDIPQDLYRFPVWEATATSNGKEQVCGE